jgi:hypothetical protein
MIEGEHSGKLMKLLSPTVTSRCCRSKHACLERTNRSTKYGANASGDDTSFVLQLTTMLCGDTLMASRRRCFLLPKAQCVDNFDVDEN